MLLNKAQLTAHERCAPHKGYFALGGMLLEPDGTTVAGDGHALMAVEGMPAPDVDYPIEHVAPAAPVIIPAALVKQALKNMPKGRALPGHLKDYVALTHCDGTVELTTTDIENTKRIDAPPLEGTFPRYPEIVPDPDKTAPLARIRFDPQLLAGVLSTVHKAINPGKGEIRSVELEIYKGTGPAIIRAETDDGQHILALVCPIVIAADSTTPGTGPSDWERALHERGKVQG